MQQKLVCYVYWYFFAVFSMVIDISTTEMKLKLPANRASFTTLQSLAHFYSIIDVSTSVNILDFRQTRSTVLNDVATGQVLLFHYCRMSRQIRADNKMHFLFVVSNCAGKWRSLSTVTHFLALHELDPGIFAISSLIFRIHFR